MDSMRGEQLRKFWAFATGSVVFGGVFGAGPWAQADILFEFDYSQSAEFTEGALGELRRQALEDAASTLGSQFFDEATPQINVTSENDDQSDTLATAASAVVDVAEDFFGFGSSVVERKVLEGVDDNGPDADGDVSVNFGIDWDLDDDIAEESFDFKATLIHELLHALGFSSGIGADGGDAYGVLPGSPGVWSVFDQFMSDRDSAFLIDDDFVLDGDLWGQLSIGGSSPGDGLFFAGAQAVAANGGAPVGLYSPEPWSDGSSGSHLDDDNPALAGMLMLAATDPGPYTRRLSPIERAILEDLGYQLKPDLMPTDPEPVPGAEFEVALQIDGDQVLVGVFGDPGEYTIEGTLDFVEWERVGTVTIEAGSDLASLEDALTDRQFYRAFAN